MSIKGNVPATYLGSGNPALPGYYPAWVDNMADDAVLEGSLLDGAVQGGEAVRSAFARNRSEMKLFLFLRISNVSLT